MIDFDIALPFKPRAIREEGDSGVYEIDGLYPGYGQTLGNSLRRILLSSLPGTAITSLKIDGIDHEFSTLAGIKEDVVTIVLNLKQTRFRLNTSTGPFTVSLNKKGVGVVTAGDIETGGTLEVTNPDLVLAHLTEKSAELKIEMTVERGLGYVPKETLRQGKTEIGNILIDASFTPIKRVFYEVENMRVGDRTDYNRLRLNIETDGVLTPRQALEKSIEIMINQLRAIIGFKEEMMATPLTLAATGGTGFGPLGTLVDGGGNMTEFPLSTDGEAAGQSEFLKTRIEDLALSGRVVKAIVDGGIRTVGGLVRKREADLTGLSGLGDKGIEEIKKVLQANNITLRD